MGTPLQDITAGAVTATAGPAEPVPVAVLARTSTLALQDPLASLRRQITSAREWLPAGWQVVAYYWDVESGGIDLEERSQGQAWEPFAAAGVPRDGGMADLLAEARSPLPRFAAVVCEDIERSGRDTFNALKLERELSVREIPLFATDEPVSVEGVNSTTVLVRRIKQGVAEWLRLQIKEKAWKGLKQHSLDGWNIGPAPYGYLADRVRHPVPAKAAQGRTKARLIPDPARAHVVPQIFTWRVTRKLSVPTITWLLNRDPAGYPPPGDGTGWVDASVTAILHNPKYTGYMVFGRSRKTTGRNGRPSRRQLPASQWIWSPEPTHPALVDKPTWDTAQTIGAERGNTRDPAMPTTQPGRRYPLRSRIRENACQHRMTGITRPSPTKDNPDGAYVYYKCPYEPSNPRHRAATPHHPPTSVSVRQDLLMGALSGFLDSYVFGPGRAAMLAAYLPATPHDSQSRHAARAQALHTEISRIDTAQASLITELEQLGPDTRPATNAYRARIRARNAELHDQRTRAETKLATLQTTAAAPDDPTLLDELPHLPAILDKAPDELKEKLFAALDVQCLYRKDKNQVTIHITITDTTPATLAALLNDPRTQSQPAHPSQPHATASNPGSVGTTPYATEDPPGS
jgi:DNA invertase Pin-like site-specific DNA recombinase